MNGVVKGVSYTWYEICNADGHPLAIPQGENVFLTEDDAVAAATEVCVSYRDTVTVREHTVTTKRIFHAEISAVEM